jgi:hypothetical protein
MRVLGLLALAFVLLTDGQAAPKPAESMKAPEKVKKDLGEKTIAILNGATRVEAFRLNGLAKVPGTDALLAFDGQYWKISAAAKEKDSKFAARLREFLYDEGTRTLSGASGFPENAVAFRAWKGKESVTVLVDFKRFSFTVITRDAKGKQVKAASGGFLFSAKGKFDDGTLWSRIKGLAVEAFPDDKALRALK